MKLIKITSDYAEKIREYRQEFIDAGDSMDGCGALRTTEDPYEYLNKCFSYEKKETLPPDRVLATQYILVRESDNRLCGMLQIRHYFNDYLSKYGGHIGYSIRPSERRKGYAKEMLRQALPHCRELGLSRVLITCFDTNIASENTIRSCGGVYESTVYEANEGVNLKRFWIEL